MYPVVVSNYLFSVDGDMKSIGVTDVTKNSRLFAVTSTTCFTLLLAVCLNCFFHPSTSSTPSVRADSSF